MREEPYIIRERYDIHECPDCEYIGQVESRTWNDWTTQYTCEVCHYEWERNESEW